METLASNSSPCFLKTHDGGQGMEYQAPQMNVGLTSPP